MPNQERREMQAAALQQVKDMKGAVTINAEMASQVCGLSPTTLIYQAKQDAQNGTNYLGFRCIVAGSRVEIVRSSFLHYLGEE